MRTEKTGPTASELVRVVTAVPGVSGIDPGVATTMRALDARVRRGGDSAHFGLYIDGAGPGVVAEVCLDRTRPVREIVRDIQAAVRAAAAGSVPDGADVTVRVQSLEPGRGRSLSPPSAPTARR